MKVLALAGLLAFAHPRICLNLDTEMRHFLSPQGIFLDCLQVTSTSFLKLSSGEWKKAFTEPLSD